MSRKTKSFSQLLSYILQHRNELKKSIGDTFILKHNIVKNSIPEWTKQFLNNELNRKYKRNNNAIIYHDVISFSRNDIAKISLKTMKDLAQQYINLRFDNSMVIAVPHQDKEHFHVHLCASGVDIETGIASRVSREDFKQIKQQLQEYQKTKYPELVNSIVNHDKKKSISKTNKEYQLEKRTKKVSNKEFIKTTIENCYRSSSSKQEFYKKVKDSGLEIYERKGEPYGVVSDRKYRFSSMGIEKDKLEDLDKVEEQLKSISEFRSEQEEKNREVEKDFEGREIGGFNDDNEIDYNFISEDE